MSYCNINVRVKNEIKKAAEKVLVGHNLTISAVMRIALSKIIKDNSVAFLLDETDKQFINLIADFQEYSAKNPRVIPKKITVSFSDG